jgi:transposase
MTTATNEWAAKRTRAFELRAAGWSQGRIARELGIGQATVWDWFRKADEAGAEQKLEEARPC